MSHTIVVDIETMLGENPEQALAPFVEGLEEKKTKTATKGMSLSEIADAPANKADAALKKGALSPVCARIACIGVKEITDTSYYGEHSVIEESEKVSFKNTFIYNPNEAQMLLDFKKIIKPQSRLVTFNGRNFDFPFMMFRAAIHKIPLNLDIYPYNKDYGKGNIHIDIMQHLDTISGLSRLGSDWSLKMVSLKKWMTYFGLGTKLSIAGGELSIVECIQTNQIDKLEQYCMNDVQKTYELFEFFKYNF